VIQQLCEQKSKGWRDLSNPFFVADTTLSCNEVQQLGGRGWSDDDVCHQCGGGSRGVSGGNGKGGGGGGGGGGDGGGASEGGGCEGALKRSGRRRLIWY